MVSPQEEQLLTQEEMVTAFWFLLKTAGARSRARLKEKMCGKEGEAILLIRAVDQFEAGLSAAELSKLWQKIVIVDPDHPPPFGGGYFQT